MSNLKKKDNKENLKLLAIGICVFLGVADEIFSYYGAYLIRVKNYEQLSITLLQVQASFSVLSVSIIALLGGRITDSYMGISYNDYVFNIKPKIFTQKKIIIMIAFSFALNVFFHIMQLYNMVITMLIISCILIYYSIDDVYAVFSGKINIENEIKLYILQTTHLKSNRKIDIKNNTVENIINNYINDWKKIILTQNNADYEEYYDTFKEMLLSIFLDNQKEYRKLIQNECQIILITLFKSQDQYNISKGCLW